MFSFNKYILTACRISLPILFVLIFFLANTITALPDNGEPFSLDVKIVKHEVKDAYIYVRILITIHNMYNESYMITTVKKPMIKIYDENNRLLYASSYPVNNTIVKPGDNVLADINITLFIDKHRLIVIKVYSGEYIIRDKNGLEYNLSETVDYRIKVNEINGSGMKMSSMANKNMQISYPALGTLNDSKHEVNRVNEIRLNTTLVDQVEQTGYNTIILSKSSNRHDLSMIYFYVLSITLTLVLTLKIVKLVFS